MPERCHYLYMHVVYLPHLCHSEYHTWKEFPSRGSMAAALPTKSLQGYLLQDRIWETFACREREREREREKRFTSACCWHQDVYNSVTDVVKQDEGARCILKDVQHMCTCMRVRILCSYILEHLQLIVPRLPPPWLYFMSKHKRR